MTTQTFHALPTLEYRSKILEAVDTHQVVIVTAETGAGKSTQIPQYLAEHGYDRVIVTQPRILAARNLTRRVREEWAERHFEDASRVIGYRTAHERDDSGDTSILYCTDGLQLVRELTGSGTRQKQILVLDEVHEWNENMEVLVAWARKRAKEDSRFKVLIMSATIETDGLAEFYETDAVINIPGRYYPVKKRQGTDVLHELFQYLEHPGHNILTFLPGKAEIQDVSDAIAKKAEAADVPVIPLHSQLEAEMQQKAFAKYPNGKIILATNIAQTSVTIDDIDLVIDSGLERRSEVRNGVEGLFLAQVSQADCTQRAGRAGRTKPGEYILAQYDTMPCMPFDERPEYPTPEILRKHIDRLTLRLANVGIDIEMLDFYHDPSRKAIQRAKRTLTALGALTPKGEVTSIGRAMEQFPVESNYARMLVEGATLDTRRRAILAAIIGIQEVGGILKGGTKYTGWRRYTTQRHSDLLAQYEVFCAVPTIPEESREEDGIIEKNVTKAEEVIERLRRDLSLADEALAQLEPDDESALSHCIVAGQIDQVWFLNDHGMMEHLSTGQERELSGSSVVRSPSLVVGTPFDLQVATPKGLQVLHLLIGVTTIKTKWLQALAPQLFSVQKSKIVYDPRAGSLVEVASIRYGKKSLKGEPLPRLEDTKEQRVRFAQEFTKWAHQQVERQSIGLARHHRRVPRISVRQVERYTAPLLGEIVALDQLDRAHKRELLAAAKLETYVGEGFYETLAEPHHSRRQTHRRRGWKPSHKRRKSSRSRP